MEITDELIAILYDKYDVYYSENLKAWVRNKGKWNKKNYDLGVITKLITGENVMIKGMSYVKYTENDINGSVCVCGCPLCETLFPMYHTKTNICFMVGSQCIKKAGHEDFVKNLKCAKNNGFCKECKFPLIRQGDRKNSVKEFPHICMDCNMPINIYLKISFNDKDKYKKYGTKWNPELKQWYWKGFKDKLPLELIPLKG